MQLILGSSSPYRKALLERLNLPFAQHSPDIDECYLEHEEVPDYVCRLSREKAQTIAKRFPDACIIASDQTAVCGNLILGKPGTIEKAHEQLHNLSGRTVTFYTGLCVLFQENMHVAMDTTTVHFRSLSEAEISRYIEIEQPLNCAGSFKSEGLGICLFERITSEDPTALMGLPLIQTANVLRTIGINPLETKS
ncbi:MAG: Maf family protein [bacterium]